MGCAEGGQPNAAGERVSFTLITAPQCSPEWFAARLGRVTGSVAGDMLAKPTTATYANLRTRLVLERLMGAPQEDGFTNDAMAWGKATEDEARIAYEMSTGASVQESGFFSHNELMAGCSLDGHLETNGHLGIIEIKCPFKSARHIATLRGGIPAEYLPQITHNLWMSNAVWCDYISYDPRLPEALRLCVVRVQASGLQLHHYEKAVRAFLADVDTEYHALLTMANPPAVLEAAI
jgi:putative phage-type endonuclease